MKRILVNVDKRGRLTIPKEIRDLLEIKLGDRLTFLIQDDNTVLVRKHSLSAGESLAGAARSFDSNLDVEEMIAIAREERLLHKYGNSSDA